MDLKHTESKGLRVKVGTFFQHGPKTLKKEKTAKRYIKLQKKKKAN